MADRHTHRRAAFFRSRAEHLLQEAEREFDEARRVHLADMAAAFAAAADELSPPAAVEKNPILSRLHPQAGR